MKRSKVVPPPAPQEVEEVSPPAPRGPAWSRSMPFHLLLLALVALLAYSNTLHVPFVLDDEPSIVENPVIKNLGTFLSGDGYRYNPRRFLGYLTIALNYRLGGLDLPGYHLFNLAVHIGTGWLVYLLGRLTLRTPFFREGAPESVAALQPVPLLAALLFVAHPVQTQAVTYVIQRVASLAALFYVAAVVSYVRGRLAAEEGRTAAAAALFSAALLAALAAMRTKEIAFTLPLVIAAYEFTFFRGSLRRRLLFLVPLLATLAVIPLGLLHSGKPLGELLSDVGAMARETTAISRGDYLLTQFSVLGTYLRLLVFPLGQNLDYDYPVYHSLFAPRVFLSFLLVAALAAAGAWLLYASGRGREGRLPRETARLAGFGIAWFFLTISVESSVIPISDVIFEHRLYLPSAGAFLAVAALAAFLGRNIPRREAAAVAAAVVCALAATTWGRNEVWGSAVSLWQDCVKKSPAKVRPHDNLANALTARGRLDEAITELQAALELRPGNASTLRNLGAAYEKKGMVEQAMELYRQAAQAAPDNVYTHYNMGIACMKAGETVRAIEEFRTAIRIDAGYADAHNNLGVAYGNKGMVDEALEEFRTAVRLDPRSADAHNNLGFALARKGMGQEAVAEFRTAISVQRDYADAYNNLGIACSSAGDHEQAIELFRTAASLQPGNARYAANLANAYRRKMQQN